MGYQKIDAHYRNMKHLLDEKEMFFQVLLFLDTGPLMIKPPSSHVDVIYNIASLPHAFHSLNHS